MTYAYNMTEDQARHFTTLPTGGEMVLVVVFKRQPEKGQRLLNVSNDVAVWGDAESDGIIPQNYAELIRYSDHTSYRVLPYPLGARIGMREAWGRDVLDGSYCRKSEFPDAVAQWRSSQTMPKSEWQWVMVVDARVMRIWDFTGLTIDLLGKRLSDAWDRNDWAEVTTIRKE